jgi:nucleoside-diphosphate-sugar epimerase/pimeloyl-ACP methyl ester carboxylesterase
MTERRHALVFGASGLIGRNVVLALAAAGVRVSAVTRSRESGGRLRDWLADHHVAGPPSVLEVDFDAAGLIAGGPEAFADVTEIYNCAGAYRFGMSLEEARRGNVGTVEAVVDFAARLPALQRLVHVSGYRVGGQDPATVPWSAERISETYGRLGPYEASKVEADAVLRARARQHGVPLSIVNPAVVIGDSTTGESDQRLGLAANLDDLWHGRLPALPGNSATFVPVVAVDHLARFMIALPADPSTVDNDYWVLDEATPGLPDLLARVGRHYRVRVPRLRIPVRVIRRLPRRLTRADPETLSFLAEDRYPTNSADEFARRHRLARPDTMNTVLTWADYLAAHRFGDAPAADRRFVDVAGIRTFELGDRDAERVILPGLPVNADTWQAVVDRTPGTRAVDLPGLGMSSGTGPADWIRWLGALVPLSPRTHLVGHSIGAAAILEATAGVTADQAPRLTLVSPFFLQPPAGLTNRLWPITAAYLRSADTSTLATRLTGGPTNGSLLTTAVEDLHRPHTATRTARLLASAARPRWREHLRRLLSRYPGEVHLIVGEHDPLTAETSALTAAARRSVTVIPGAGHHPQLTHPAEVAKALEHGPLAES